MLIFLNIQTTGVESCDKICSVGLVAIDKSGSTKKYDLVKEGKKILPKASSINHITNEMLKDKPAFKDSDAYKFLQENNSDATTLVMHNIPFTMQYLNSAGFHFKGEMIDTQRVCKHLIAECEEFSLQFLRYELKLYKKEKDLDKEHQIQANHSLSDAMIVKLLYDYLLDISTKEQMAKLSFENVLMQKLNFGKYNGRYIEEIMNIDRGYLNWMLEKVLDLDEDLRYSIDYYLREHI